MSAIARPFAVQAFVLALCFHSSTARAAEPDETNPLSPGETEIIALTIEFNQKLEGFWEQGGKLTDREQLEKFYKEQDPGVEYLPKFLAFERAHTGEDAGLDALQQVCNYAARSGDPDSYRAQARRDALSRMQPYEDRELAMFLVGRLTSGAYDPQVTDYMRRLGKSPTANPKLAAYARLKFADQALTTRAVQGIAQDELKNFAAGMTADHPEMEAFFRNFLTALPPNDELDAQAVEAITLLEELADSGDKFRLPEYRAVDPVSRILRIDAEKTKIGNPFSTKAAALLFQERHLRRGQPAPQLELELIDGRRWLLTEHRGQVVVIQFSFTGCGPCEAMYPDLRTMADELGDRLSLVTIMRDETPANAQQAQESGKITWDIACDGVPGKICTEWAVNGFPEIYVIDPQGKIAAVGPRGKQLRWKVERLTTPAE